ncbi:hypothetical protein KUTeg_004066 [Tegillarca granosa]|uniref:CARD domain-containing protein n=1 Tax=Tegillarca granosa TaxID=220873 RepID=A0ABQ9FTE1_TEGGR|nr:hypothetical protein KUTeg_004066 [Tegillarca granosa]
MSEGDEDAYDEKIENNRYHIVKILNPEVTFDVLRQERILTEEDVERIRNKTTRRKRAGALLDILRTKGNNGVNKFVDCLEYENPECFEKITRQKARLPPPDYTQNRQSVLLKILNELPRIILDIKRDVKEKKDLTQTLDDSEQILEFAQKEKQELEEENEKLRKRIDLLHMQMNTLKSESEKTIEKLKCDNAEHKRDRYLLRTENDRFKENLMKFQKIKDLVEKENQNLREKMSQERDAETKRRSALLQSKSLDKKESETITLHILREQRDEAREKAEILAEDLSILRQELEETQTAYYREHENVKALSIRTSELHAIQDNKRKKIDEYNDYIEQQNQEIEELVNQRREEQKKCEEQKKRANKIFAEKHNIENRYDDLKFKYDDLKFKYDKLKTEHSYCKEKINNEKSSKKGSTSSSKSSTSYEMPWDRQHTEPVSCSSQHAKKQMKESFDSGQDPTFRQGAIANPGSDSSSLSLDLHEVVQFDVHGEFLPPKIERINKNCNQFKIVLKTPIIGEKLNIIGGNITGIFVQDVLQENGNIHLLKIGDEITEIHICSTHRHVNGASIKLHGMTLEQVKNLLSPTEEMDVEMSITHDPTRYGVIKQWLSHNESNGDYFYVRCQFSWSVSKCVPDSIPFKAGDVFRVTNTNNTGHEGFWRVVKITGGRSYGLIPNMESARTHQMKTIKNADHKTECHHDAFRPLTKMPVFVFGTDELVEEVMNLMIKEGSNYVLNETGNCGNSTDSKIKDSKTSKKHLLFKGGAGTKSNNLKYINIFVTSSADCQDIIKKIFDKYIAVEDSDLLYKVKSKFEICGATYDIITINAKQCYDKESLLKSIQDRVTNAQNRYMWLSETELSTSILDKYSTYIKCPELPILTETASADTLRVKKFYQQS